MAAKRCGRFSCGPQCHFVSNVDGRTCGFGKEVGSDRVLMVVVNDLPPHKKRWPMPASPSPGSAGGGGLASNSLWRSPPTWRNPGLRVSQLRRLASRIGSADVTPCGPVGLCIALSIGSEHLSCSSLAPVWSTISKRRLWRTMCPCCLPCWAIGTRMLGWRSHVIPYAED